MFSKVTLMIGRKIHLKYIWNIFEIYFRYISKSNIVSNERLSADEERWHHWSLRFSYSTDWKLCVRHIFTMFCFRSWTSLITAATCAHVFSDFIVGQVLAAVVFRSTWAAITYFPPSSFLYLEVTVTNESSGTYCCRRKRKNGFHRRTLKRCIAMAAIRLRGSC